MSNYHGCKEEVINLIPHYLIDIIYKIVKPSHLEKLQMTQYVNKLMFQVIFILPDWILIEQIIASSTPSVLGENIFSKHSTWSLEWGTVTWVKMHRLNAFSRNVRTLNLTIFPTHVGIQKSEKIQQVFWRDKTLRSLKKYERMYPWG